MTNGLLGIQALKFSRDAEELARVAVITSTIATFVSPLHRLRVLREEPDNRVVECALTRRAQAFVIGDWAMLSVGARPSNDDELKRGYVSTVASLH